MRYRVMAMALSFLWMAACGGGGPGDASGPGGRAAAVHTPPPTTVTIVGSLQDELGCPGDWQPDCASTSLSYDSDDEVWRQTFTIPAGAWEYKAALNETWDENYGLHAMLDGPNVALNPASDTDVKFYYDRETHWITDNQNSVIATVAGSFQDELGGTGDWQPDCLRSWLQDSDGDGIYSHATSHVPPGDYEAKVATTSRGMKIMARQENPTAPTSPSPCRREAASSLTMIRHHTF